MKIKVLSTIPMSDEQIMAGEPLKFKIGEQSYHINQITYKQYHFIQKWLTTQGLILLGYPEKNLMEDPKVKTEVEKLIEKDNERIYSLVDLLTEFIHLDPPIEPKKEKSKGKVISEEEKKEQLEKILMEQCQMSDLIFLLENLFRFNFVIKKKLLHIIQTSPEQYQADLSNSEITAGMPRKLLALVKDGIPVPRLH